MKYFNLKIIGIVTLITSGCLEGGTLGGFDSITFPTSKSCLVRALDTLYSRHPEYIMPSKWKSYDDWHERGYDFLDSRMFYFGQTPEEVYYISFIGDANDSVQVDTTRTSISIRAYRNEEFGWTDEGSCTSAERTRIQLRFDQEIISKLEEYTNTKSLKEK